MLSFVFCRWEGDGTNEVGKDKATGKIRIKINPKYNRPTEVVSHLKFFKKNKH